MTTFAVPVPGRRQAKAINSFEAVTSWATDIDRYNEAVSESFGKLARSVALLTTTSSLGIGIVPLHAPTHAPGGSDAILTGTPVPVGTTNSAGVGLALIRNDHIHQGIHSIDAGGADLYGDVTFAASGTSLSVAQVGQTITYTLASGMGSGLDADTIDGLDSTAFLRHNGSVPLTTAWFAGNFAITLGSIVGASGNLSIAAAASGGITMSGSDANIVFNPSADSTFTMSLPGAAGSGGTTLFNVASTSGLGVAKVLNFQVSVNTSGTFSGVTSTASQAGAGAAVAYVASAQSIGPATTTIAGQKLAPFEGAASYISTSTLGHRAADRLSGATAVLGWANNTAARAAIVGPPPGDAVPRIVSWGYYTGNTGTPNPLPIRWAGILVGLRPGGQTAGLGVAATVGIHTAEDIQLESNANYTAKLIFDGAATMAPSLTLGSSTFSALTKGDTYLTYNSGATQLDVFVDGSQAAHWDAGGVAGSSRIYGALTISGGITGGLTINTGNLVVTAGDVSVAATEHVIFDGAAGDSYLSYETSFGFVRIDVFVDGNQAFHFGDAGAAGTSWCYGNFRVDGTSTLVGNVDAYAGIDILAGNLNVEGNINLGGYDTNADTIDDTWYFLQFDGTANYSMTRQGSSIRVTAASAAHFFDNLGLEVVSQFKTTSGLTLTTAGLTHNPGSPVTFTVDLNDSILFTDNSSSTTRALCDVYWAQAGGTNTKTLFKVRSDHSLVTALEIKESGVQRMIMSTGHVLATHTNIPWVFDTGGSTLGTTYHWRNAGADICTMHYIEGIRSFGTDGLSAVVFNVGTITASGVKIGKSGGDMGFYGTAPVAQSTGWSLTGGGTAPADRSFDYTSPTSATEPLEVLASVVKRLLDLGLISA